MLHAGICLCIHLSLLVIFDYFHLMYERMGTVCMFGAVELIGLGRIQSYFFLWVACALCQTIFADSRSIEIDVNRFIRHYRSQMCISQGDAGLTGSGRLPFPGLHFSRLSVVRNNDSR